MNRKMRNSLALRLMFILTSIIVYAATAHSARTAAGKEKPLIVTNLNDVMDGAMPPVPSFPKLAKKPGYLRGYVKDSRGRAVPGAYIMITPAALWGSSYSRNSTTVRSDDNGLYEVKILTGGCRIWCAGQAMSYHGVRLALPLHPADGEFDTVLPLKEGAIENLILLPYGVANESTASENPVYSAAYYGASFTIGYSLREPEENALPPEWLAQGSEVEITLTPEGPLLDGSEGRPLVIRKKLTTGSYFQVNDVPIGQYRMRARLITDGGGNEPLRLKDNSRSDRKGGLEPKEGEDVTALFRSASGDPGTVRAVGGNMERLSLLIERHKPH